MTLTEPLKLEHQIILKVLDAAAREARSIQDKGRVNAEAVEKMVDFFRNFADRCHHAKEEKHLYVRMRGRVMEDDECAIPVMLHQHEEGRRRIRAISEALPRAKEGDLSALASVSEELLAYTGLLRTHIENEDNHLFPLAERLFSVEDRQSLAEGFETVEAEEMGEGVHGKYHRIANELAKA